MVHFSGFYAWLKEPLSQRVLEDARQTELIQQAWTDSGKVYGYRKLADDLRDAGETCSENRVARLAGIAAQIGYKRQPRRFGAKPSVVADATLDRQFEVDAPDRFWVTDITYIRMAVPRCGHRPILKACRGLVDAVSHDNRPSSTSIAGRRLAAQTKA